MAALEGAGTAQNRKIYARHGVTAPCFGVSYGELGKLARTIRTDHDLARELWATGNHDARELAGKIADPDRLTRAEADRWARDADNYVTAGTVAGVVARSRWARACSDDWRNRRSEWVAAVGWGIVAHTAEDPELWTAPELRRLITQIETEIDTRPNRVRHEMNMVLIAIALRDGNLRRSVLAVARRVRADLGRSRGDRVRDLPTSPPTWSAPWPTAPAALHPPTSEVATPGVLVRSAPRMLRRTVAVRGC